MKNVLTFALALLIASSLNGKNNPAGFTLEGKFLRDYSGYIFLRYDGKTDSVLVSDNVFSFKGKINDKVSYATLYIEKKSHNVISGMYLENTSMKVVLSLIDKPLPDGKVSANLEVVSVEGTKTAEMERQYREFYEKNKSNSDFTKLLVSKVSEIIAADPTHPFSGTAFFRLALREDIDKSTLIELHSKLTENSMDPIQRRKLDGLLFPERFISVNDQVFNFTLPDRNGQFFDIASLKGKWYLIDFWASWCGPCRKQLPELKRVYESNKDKDFQILGVSIDEKKENWIKALETENLSWLNVIENAAFGGTIATKYQVSAVPTNFLINPEGKVVAKNLSVNKLEEFLKTIK